MNDDALKVTLFLCVGLIATPAICWGIASIIHISVEPGYGQQIGYITEVENSGIVWRPDEIVLIGSEATFSSSQTSWEYASSSPEITELARQYLKNHKKVVVQYETVLFVFGWEYSHATRITGIADAAGVP